MVTEAEKIQDPPSTSWTPRKAEGVAGELGSSGVRPGWGSSAEQRKQILLTPCCVQALSELDGALTHWGA